MTLDEWRAAGRWFTFQGHRIFLRDEGTGDVLVCIHGFPTASWDWHRLWPSLTARWRVVAPDMLGFGFSAKPREHRYSIHEQASLHEELLASLGVERVHILAHDYGDTVAQELLARHLERSRLGELRLEIASACLLNGGLFPEAHRARLTQRLLASRLGPHLARVMNERSFGRSLAAVFGPRTQPTPAELHDFWRLMACNDGTGVAHLLIGYMAERRRHRERWVGVLSETAVPIRLVNGPEDPVSGRHMVERYRELVPAPDVVLLAGIGHYPQVEDPDGVLGAYLAFRDRLETDARRV
jgi:pimeloyl-ACP methyl ester carboxylesterase